MGFCSRRYLFFSICLLQTISIVERQVFDFLGFLWIPILVNFFEIILIILGFFGAYQYRPKYIISYTVWHLLWVAWNVFLICLYLNIGDLNHKTNPVLKLDSKSESWWSTEGPGCKEVVPFRDDTVQLDVENCFVNYVHVELFQAALQCFLGIIGIITGGCLSRAFLEEDDTSSRKSSSRKNPQRMSLYSIEFSSQSENRQGDSDSNDFDLLPQPVSPKPMTPRRVKRRSVMTRGSSGRHSSSRRHSTQRSSTRSSARRVAQNPVTRLLEQQQQQKKNITTHHPYDSPATPSPIEPLPNYYNNMFVTNDNHRQQEEHWQNNGHSNPTYQQSSTQSLNDTDDFEDLYNSRPASVRSSYSNFHGTRTISYTSPKHYHSHATPQVPQKRTNPNRSSMRSVAFLNNGPPAYTSRTMNHQNQPSIDSETTI